jgi:uncharacterized protein
MATTAKAARCPICGKPRVEEFRPFCSRRCADIDLHRWLGGSYAIPAVEADDAEPDDQTPGDERSH